MRDTGLVVEEQAGEASSDGGPRPWLAKINSYGLYVACVEVAHGHARCGIADVFGRLLPADTSEASEHGYCYDERVGTSVRDDPTSTLDWIQEKLTERVAAVFAYEHERMAKVAAKRAWLLRERPAVVSAGISAAGPVDPRNGKLRCANPRDGAGFSCGAWRGTSIGQSLEARLGESEEWEHCDFYTENDANLCAAAELHAGVLRDHAHAIVAKWTGGVGGAVVLNGEVYVGSEGFAGEFGQSQSAQTPSDLTLGQRVGIAAISRRLRPEAYAEFRAGGCEEELLRDWFVDNVLALARDGSPVPPEEKEAQQRTHQENRGDDPQKIGTPREELRRAAAELGVALVPHVDMLNPQVIVISGGVFTNKDRALITEPMMDSLRGKTSHFSSSEVDVIFGDHELHPALDGAVASRLADPAFPALLLERAAKTVASPQAA